MKSTTDSDIRQEVEAETAQTQRDRELNIFHDDTSIDPNQLSNDERQKVMNNLPTQSLSSSLASAVETKTKEDESGMSPNLPKTTEEIEQDIYKAALDLMPGESSDGNDGKGTSTSNTDISAEEMLKDILKFSEEKEEI